MISPDWRCWSCVRLCFPGVTGGFAVAELWGISYRFDCALLPQPGWAQSCLSGMALMACSASLCSPVDFLNSTVLFSLPRFISPPFPFVVCLVGLYRGRHGRIYGSAFACPFHVFMRLNALCEESSHWETGPNGTILVSGIGEIGALRVFEAMCHSGSLMRPRRPEMLHRDCRQSSSPVQNPRPALRFRLDKRDVPYWPTPGAPGVLRRVREAYPWLALSHHDCSGSFWLGSGDGWI